MSFLLESYTHRVAKFWMLVPYTDKSFDPWPRLYLLQQIHLSNTICLWLLFSVISTISTTPRICSICVCGEVMSGRGGRRRCGCQTLEIGFCFAGPSENFLSQSVWDCWSQPGVEGSCWILDLTFKYRQGQCCLRKLDVSLGPWACFSWGRGAEFPDFVWGSLSERGSDLAQAAT